MYALPVRRLILAAFALVAAWAPAATMAAPDLATRAAAAEQPHAPPAGEAEAPATL